MSASRQQQLACLFRQALKRPDSERAAFVKNACGDDAELRAALESLLNHDHHADAVCLSHRHVSSIPSVACVISGAKEFQPNLASSIDFSNSGSHSSWIRLVYVRPILVDSRTMRPMLCR